ncbi:MAG TPA: hypothetical protein VKT49_15920 [Bryobacteraceae bacterium]|nr:hypothetical protein [Bryobacteraceae bacterium]
MARPPAEAPRLARVTKICLALPETTRELHGSYAAFLVRKKTFAYFLNDHHGAGVVSVTGKVLPGFRVCPKTRLQTFRKLWRSTKNC